MLPTLRHELVNAVIQATGAKSFLQFGSALYFDEVTCPVKKSAHFEAADQIPPGKLYDVVYVDPPADPSRAAFAIRVALEHTSPTGVVLVANCNPALAWMQEVPASAGVQLGQVWRAWVALRAELDREMVVADMDHGVGIILPLPASARASIPDRLDFPALAANRTGLLGLLPVRDVLALVSGGALMATDLAPSPVVPVETTPDPPKPRRQRRDRAPQ